MHVPKAVAIIDWPQVAFDRRHDVTVQHVKVIGGFALVKQQPAEFPTVKQPSEVGFIAAFQRRPYGPNEVRSAPKPGPVILLKEMVLEDVEVGLEFYNWNAHVKNVSGQGVLRQSFREPGAQNFTFAMAAHVESGDVEFARSTSTSSTSRSTASASTPTTATACSSPARRAPSRAPASSSTGG
jgi:hypothetical protein